MNDHPIGRRFIGAFAALCVMLMVATPLAAVELRFATPGASKEVRKLLLAASLLQSDVAGGGTSDPAEVLAAARADYGRLVGALYDQGHYSGVISIRLDGREAANISPLGPPSQVRVVEVSVNPGGPFTFGRAQIGPLAPETLLPPGFAPGQPAKTEAVRDAALAAVTAWQDAGHAKALPDRQNITADHAARRLDTEIGINPGPRVTFGRFLIKGNTRTKEQRIREIAGFPEGTVYSPAELELAAKRLRRTGAFRSVSIKEAEALGPEDTLDITTTLVEEKRRRLGYGAEYSTIEGFTLSAFWLHRNLLGGAERLRFDAEISGIGGTTGGIDYALGTRLTRPATFGPDTSSYFEAELERLDEPNFQSENASVGVGLSRIISETLTAEVGVEYRFSHVTDASGTTDFHLLNLPLNVVFDNRDNALDATTGYFVDATVMPFVGLNGSSSGARISADARTYRQFGERLTLAGRLQFGSVAGAAIGAVPQDYLFYSGGGGTVRGHSYQSLGVTSGGATTGGRSFAGMSVELRSKVTDKIGVVGFFDYGYVGAESFPDGSGASHSGAGLGLRYDTGIGPIRLDVAAPLSGAGNNLQVYVGIGQAF